jgi:PAS domain S-box-containing protein
VLDQMKQADLLVREMIEKIPILAWSCQPDGTADFLNQRWLDYTGLSTEAAVGWGWQAAIHSEDLGKLMDTWLRLLATGEPGEVEGRLRRFDGEHRWFLFRAIPIRDEEGRVVRWYGTNTDIEDRKWAETLLAGENRLLKIMAEDNSLSSILDALCRVVEELSAGTLCSILFLDSDGHRLRHAAAPSLPASYTEAIDGSFIGPRAGSCGTAAYRREPVIVSDIITDPLWADYSDLASTHGLRACWSTPIFSSAGRVLGTFAIYSHEPCSPSPQQQTMIEQFSHLASIAIERAQAFDALRRSESYLAYAQRLSLTGSFCWRVSSREITWSEETFRIYEYSPMVKPTMELACQRIHPEDITLFQERVMCAPQEGKDVDFEHRLMMPDGAVKYVKVVACAVRDKSGKLVEFVGAVMDVTAAKKAEDRIRQDEREFRQIVEAIPQLILVLTPDGSPLYGNELLLEYTGLTLDDVRAGDFRARAFHPDDVERLRDERRQALARGVSFEMEQRVLRKGGQYRWFLTRFNPVLDGQGHVIRWYATGTDIDDRKRDEERIQKENLALREEIDHSSMFEEIIGSSKALRKVLVQVAKVAPSDSTVLVLGETGTGKELIARAIHKRSKRASRAFIRVNCAAIPASLIASELFGHEKGAFTGALQRRLGRFELADGGTIFLDEIGDLPAETQIALLRVLQEKEIERVGGSQSISVDVRVLAATNRDLKAAMAAGTFRQDLFYRLNVFPIQVPSLRERVDDIPLLVTYMVERYAQRAGKQFRNIQKETLERFQAYYWPGNIRELQNVIERAVVLCDSETFSVDETWLKTEALALKGPAVPFDATLFEREKEMIEAALADCGGQVAGPTGAAAKLGLPRQTLDSRIKVLGIDKYRFKTRQVDRNTIRG